MITVGDEADDSSDSDRKTTDIHTAKPLQKGTLFFTSGHVQNLMDTSSKDQYFLKAKVMSSFQPKTMYDVSVAMSAESSVVVDASCACRASAMERCNHVCAVLFPFWTG